MSTTQARAGNQPFHATFLDENPPPLEDVSLLSEERMFERGEYSDNSSRRHHEPTLQAPEHTTSMRNGNGFRNTQLELDRNHIRKFSWLEWSSRRHVMLGFACLTAFAVFLINLIFGIVMFEKKGLRAVVSIYEGSCSWGKRVDTGIHILINILSTLLLGASNLCMQLLAAPTRQEVKNAHRKGDWLDIGVPSWRNLWRIEPQRRVIWWFLALSSIPVHFIYNSVISSSIPSFGYGAAVVPEQSLHQTPWEFLEYGGNSHWPSEQDWDSTAAFEYMQEHALLPQYFTNLTKSECVEVYTNVYGNRTNLMVITEDSDIDQDLRVHGYDYVPAQWSTFSAYWLCEYNTNLNSPGSINCQDIESNTPEKLDQWTMGGRPVKYCLSQRRSADYCRLNYSPYILIVICITSLFKAVCIFWAACNLRRHESTLVTLGDAICSFLEEEDETTAGIGIVTQKQFKRPFRLKQLFRSKRPFLPVWTRKAITTWTEKIPRWYSLASGRRWFVTSSLFCIIIFGACVSIGYGVRGTMQRGAYPTFKSVLLMDFGAPDPTSFTAYFLPRSGTVGFMSHVLWANCWQIIISGLYVAENSLLTSMLVGREWANYAIKRKPLRVSHPKGVQRSTYYLSMPFRYAIPVMIANTVLHWLVSQSVFLVSTITFYPNAVEDEGNSFFTTGYSSNATFAAIIFGAFTGIVFVAIVTTRQMPSSMPLVLSCSAAISAACHPGQKVDCYQDPVSWGVVDEPDESKEKPGRCSLTTYPDIRQPREGEKFSGVLSSDYD